MYQSWLIRLVISHWQSKMDWYLQWSPLIYYFLLYGIFEFSLGICFICFTLSFLWGGGGLFFFEHTQYIFHGHLCFKVSLMPSVSRVGTWTRRRRWSRPPPPSSRSLRRHRHLLTRNSMYSWLFTSFYRGTEGGGWELSGGQMTKKCKH